jgi:septation ring formation regulator EzrA
METVILVSVLSTLGVVAVLTSVVVAFIKLKGKVDVNNFREEMKSFHDYLDHIERERRHSLDEVHLRITKEEDEYWRRSENELREIQSKFDTVWRDMQSQTTNLYSHIDSRCDKLDSKIKIKN